jgi:membrane protein involved in D-alanine export
MTPYSHIDYFLIILAILLPMTVAGARGRADGRWIVGATVLMLVLQYKTLMQITRHLHWPELVALLLFGLWQWILLRLALAKKLPGGSKVAIPLGLLPLAVAKFLPEMAPGCQFGFAGISYVTFRALDVLWAVTDGVLAEVAFLDFGVFLFFFPTISAGPIDRFRRFKSEWRQRRTAQKFWADLDAGIPLLMRGLLYKFVIGTLIERHLLEQTRTAPGILGAVEYAYVYSAYLFFDFAGYSAFAIGVSRWFGISTPANFNLPWAAQNIREFWNRWHMSLSFWFRDHVYSRFLLSAVKGKWFTKRETPATLGYFVSFGLMGLWHGLTWYYILYGLYHATLMAGYDGFTRWKKRNPKRFSGRSWKWPAHFITIHAVIFGLWLFSGQAWQRSDSQTKPTAQEQALEEPENTQK